MWRRSLRYITRRSRGSGRDRSHGEEEDGKRAGTWRRLTSRTPVRPTCCRVAWRLCGGLALPVEVAARSTCSSRWNACPRKPTRCKRLWLSSFSVTGVSTQLASRPDWVWANAGAGPPDEHWCEACGLVDALPLDQARAYLECDVCGCQALADFERPNI